MGRLVNIDVVGLVEPEKRGRGIVADLLKGVICQPEAIDEAVIAKPQMALDCVDAEGVKRRRAAGVKRRRAAATES
jgi:hypothetical protein